MSVPRGWGCGALIALWQNVANEESLARQTNNRTESHLRENRKCNNKTARTNGSVRLHLHLSIQN